MRQIPLGARGTSTLRVQPEHLADRFKDAILPQVLATPVMILIMENAALNAIRPFLDAGESAVGTAVDVQHFAATPVGHEVCATAEVVNVEGKRVDFKVWASDGIEEDRQRNPPTNCDRSSFVQRAPCQKKELLTQRSA
jgi:fluoroacetyl-CoA thioesterase